MTTSEALTKLHGDILQAIESDERGNVSSFRTQLDIFNVKSWNGSVQSQRSPNFHRTSLLLLIFAFSALVITHSSHPSSL